MNFDDFRKILNKHIFEGEKIDLLKKLANRPERFVGLFRPTKPGAKILQHLLQSHEIRFGDAMEELIDAILRDLGYTVLPKNIQNSDGENLSIDQYFTDENTYYFIEQKVRDDHDSTKKRGQINNFEKKLEILHNIHDDQLVGIMYFIDPDLSKNKNFYLQELQRLEDFYGVDLHLLYGRELFEYLERPTKWDEMISWLTRWKDNLPDLPEINFDAAPDASFEEIKALEIRYWRKILQNEKLWDDGIIKVLFRDGSTLRLLLDYFREQHTTPYRNLERLLAEKMEYYYENE